MGSCNSQDPGRSGAVFRVLPARRDRLTRAPLTPELSVPFSASPSGAMSTLPDSPDDPGDPVFSGVGRPLWGLFR